MIALTLRAVCLSLMLFMVLCYPTAAAAAGQRPTVMVTDYNVYPDVLMPGDTGTITVTITNMEEQARQTETTMYVPLQLIVRVTSGLARGPERFGWI